MCALLSMLLESRRARRAQRDREYLEFQDRCRHLVERHGRILSEAGLAQVELHHGDEGLVGMTLTPGQPAAAAVYIDFDYPTFHLTIPRAEQPDGLGITAELFGSYEERLVEVEQRIDAIVAGRLEWEYRPSGGHVIVRWLKEDGEPFLETSYRGPQQGEVAASGRTAPYSG